MNIGFFDGTFDVPECAGYVQGWKYRQVDGEAFALGILLFRLKFPLEDCSRGFAEPGRTIEDFFLNHELDHGLDYKSFQAIWGLMRSDPNDRCKIENILELAICERVRLHPSVEPSTVQMVSSECFYTL